MTPLTPADAVTALNRRYAVKKFDPARTIPPDTWAELEEALRLSPSSYGLQPWKFVVVTDPTVRRLLRPAAWDQSQITDASHLVVFCVKKGMGPADADRLVRRIAQVRGVPVESLDGYKGMMSRSLSKPASEVDPWMTHQVYIALGVFLATAAVVGVDACPMEGFQPDQFDQLLGLSARGYGSVVLAAAGYRAADDPYAKLAKVRYEPAEVIERV